MSQNDYFQAFKAAEGHIKSAENLVRFFNPIGEVEYLRGLLMPAVNELRYAGRHAIHAAEATSGDEREERFVEAKKHCFRASYDAFDAQLQYLIGECDLFQRDFRRVPIAPVIDSYQDDCRTLNRLKMIDYRRTGNREDHWAEMERHGETLRQILEKWNTGREELNKILRKEQLDRWYKTLAIIGGLTTVAVAAVALIAGLLK